MGEREAPARAREVGDTLRQIREATDLTISDVAERLGWSTAKVSRVERGAAAVSPVELVRFAAHCGAHIEDIDVLLDWCKEVVPPGYWLSDQFASLIFHESTADYSSSYDPLVVPGLLQTEDYATALFGAKYAGMRMERQRLLNRRGFEFFVHEQALRLPVGSNRVMNEQMLKLVLLAAQPRITIRVVPAAPGEYAMFGGEFVLFRYSGSRPLVFVAIHPAGLFLEDHDYVTQYQGLLSRMSEVALGRGESRELLAQLASEFDRPEDSRDVVDHLAKEQF
jgi:transcriptional regulator with XRE-family HTH domain